MGTLKISLVNYYQPKKNYMKAKLILLSLVLITITTTATYAQGFHLGIKGGANIYKIDGRSFDDEFKFAYSVGAFAEINFNKHFGIQPELLWSQTNFRTASDFNTVVPQGFNDVKGSLNYLTIPLLLTYRPVKAISFQLGPQFGYLINQTTIAETASDAFKKGDFSIVGGAQLNLGGLKIGARYFIGLNNISNISNTDTWKNQGFQMYVGFRII
jgi:outer membrane protein with beta-barrel domain